MKIVMSSHTGVFRGGAERSLVLLASHLIKNGDTVMVVIPDSSNELKNILESRGIPYLKLLKDGDKRPVRLRNLPKKIIKRCIYVYKFYLWLRIEKPDVVYLNTTRTLSDLAACKLARVSTLVHIRGFDSRFPMRYFFCLWADRVIVLNQSARTFFRKFKFGMDRIRVVPNGVTISAAVSNNHQLAVNQTRILYIGGYEKRKGTPAFLRLSSEIANSSLEFHHIGDPNPKDFLTERALEEYSGRVVEHGVIADVPRYISDHGFEYFLLLSESEGMPRSLLEAMERGLVPIVSRIPEHMDIVTADLGFLFDTSVFEEEVLRLRKFLRSTNIAVKSEAVRSHIASSFNIDVCNSKLRESMQELC